MGLYMKKEILDQQDKIFKNDPENMLSCIEDLPDQIKDCWMAVTRFVVPAHYINIKNIVVCGLGGSAIGADLVRMLVFDKSSKPITLVRDYDIPAFADRDTLIIASSYSGNTEETLSCYQQAIESGCKVIGIANGGKLMDACKKDNIPCFKIEYESQPRAAMGYSMMTLLGILSKLGIVDVSEEEIILAYNELKEMQYKLNASIPLQNNQAKLLAVKMHNYLPFIIGSGVMSEVAHRSKITICENAKQLAFFEAIPEMNHNTLTGMDFPDKLNEKSFVLVLQSKYDHERNKLRQRIFVDILAKRKINYETIMFPEAKSKLSEMLIMIQFTDYLSYYMATLNQIDPTPVKMVEYLKTRLKKGK